MNSIFTTETNLKPSQRLRLRRPRPSAPQQNRRRSLRRALASAQEERAAGWPARNKAGK